MTVGGDFIPTGDGNDYDGPTYPSLFGISLTPTVMGLLIGLVGLAGAIWLLLNLVLPTWQKGEELSQDIAAKEQQLVGQAEVKQQIENAQANLKDAEQLHKDVLNLFASEKSLDTLLLDVNERVNAVNEGVQDPKKRAVLSKFDLNPSASGPVVDDSLGIAVKNRLKRQVYDVEIKGSFVQTQSIVRNIERLQPLLVISNFRSVLDASSQEVLLDPQGKVTSSGKPDSLLTTSFQLSALVPLDAMPAAPAAQPSPSPSPSP